MKKKQCRLESYSSYFRRERGRRGEYQRWHDRKKKLDGGFFLAHSDCKKIFMFHFMYYFSYIKSVGTVCYLMGNWKRKRPFRKISIFNFQKKSEKFNISPLLKRKIKSNSDFLTLFAKYIHFIPMYVQKIWKGDNVDSVCRCRRRRG